MEEKASKELVRVTAAIGHVLVAPVQVDIQNIYYLLFR